MAGWGALLRLQTCNGAGEDGLAGEVFDVPDAVAVAEFGKGYGCARAACAACATNAVGVVFGFHGQAKVKDVADAGHVNAACGYVGGYQKLDAAFA